MLSRLPNVAVARKIGLLLILIVAGVARCLGQVYSQSIYGGGVYESDWWSVGSPPFKFGLGQTAYEKDSNGFIIFATFAPATRKPQPGDTWHCQTRVFLGSLRFGTALPPLKLAVLASAAATMAGLCVYVLFTRWWKAVRTPARKVAI